MHRRSFLTRTAALAALPAAGCATADPHAGVEVNRGAVLLAAIDLNGAPGAALGVVRAGRVVALGGKGRRGPQDAVVPDADTVFEIGSLTKTFTASLIFELEAEGRLDASRTIGDYVLALPEAWRGRTLESLLSHTSGLPEYLDAGNFLELMPRDLPPRDLIALAAAKPVDFESGARHAYSNTGFVLLGMAAEAVGGASYWDQIETRFLRPAGMTRTGPRGRIRPDSNMASGRFWDGESWNDHPPISAPGSTFSAGGLTSTARDLTRWAAAIDRGAVLSPHARRRIWRPAHLADGSPAGWGYGWVVEQVEGRTLASHGGGTAGFSCWFRRDIEAELTTVVLTNQNGRADPLEMTDQVLAALA
ncbi:MAG: serine hydrolase domain-containing protein [Brevundimonas sp.]|nr:serine hydrolase domain-containing protein [Brevundimonas sp.]